MKSVRTKAILAASVVGLVSLGAQAAPLVNYQVLGKITGSTAAFASTVTVSAGQSVDIRLVPTFAPVGTANGTFTLSGITASSDGFNNLPTTNLVASNPAGIVGSFVGREVANLDENDVPVSTTTYGGQLTSTWAASTGFYDGERTDPNTVTGIKPIRAPGNIAANTSATTPIAWRSTYSITSTPGTLSVLGLSITNGSGGFQAHMNGDAGVTGILTTNATESSSPFLNLVGLNLVTASLVTNNPPSFTAGSGLQSGNAVVDATLDIINPINLVPHSVTFSIPDSFITDEAAASAVVTLGAGATTGGNAALAGHISISGRNIIVTGNYTDYPGLNGTYAVPLVLTDNQSATSAGTFTLSVVPEPTSIGLLGLGGLALLRRRKSK